jgi:hypothetical protein
LRWTWLSFADRAERAGAPERERPGPAGGGAVPSRTRPAAGTDRTGAATLGGLYQGARRAVSAPPRAPCRGPRMSVIPRGLTGRGPLPILGA